MKKLIFTILTLCILLVGFTGCQQNNNKHDCNDFKSDWIITEKASCGEEELQKIICTKCEKVLEERKVMIEHSYEITNEKDKTCTEDGEVTYTCKLCNDSYVEKISSTGHEYESEIVKEATCTEDGEKKYTCKLCNDSYVEKISSTDHEYESEIVKEATCTEDGEVTYTCKLCNDSYVEKISSTGHEYESEIVKEATCTEDGEKKYTCKLCNETYTETIPSKTGHDYEVTEQIDKTCTEDGEVTYTCKLCNDSYVEKISSTGHDYEVTEQIDKTCTIDGKTTYTCKNCNDSYSETDPKTGHDYEVTEQIDKTCTIDGKTTYTCKNCNDSYSETDSKTGHDYEVTERIDQTCEQNGKITYTCKNCNDSYVENINKIGHSFIETDTKEATCEDDGYVKYECENCGKVSTTVVSATGHTKGKEQIISQPTGNTPGIKRYSCVDCGKVLEEVEFFNTPYQQNGKLSVDGRDLVNQYGEKIQLFGLSTHGIHWFSKFVNYDTIAAIREGFGNNVIRFALYTDENGYCDGGAAVKQKMLNTLIKGIDIATELGLYVIVDWHMVGAENPLDKNPLTYLEESKEFFSYISEYYKDQDNILYEIMNEPNGSTTWADCKKYANEVIPCIRKNTDAVVLVGNPKWTADLNSVMKDPLTGYENIMYTYHFYAADHSNTTQVSTAYDAGFPVFISEFGFMESSGDGDYSETNGNKWKKVLDSRNISYVAWNISNSGGSASIFKQGTTKLADVSDSNLKPWGIYLKNWYKAKSLNISEEKPEIEIPTANFELIIESEESNGYLQCFIVTDGFNTSRLTYDWSSTDESVVTISEYSTITIHGDGTCCIIAKSKTTDAVGVLDIVIENGQLKSYSSRYTG